jgi:Holliday junction resolvasome RuvABC endonuclease subunit
MTGTEQGSPSGPPGRREVRLVRGVQHDLAPELNAIVHVLYEGTALCAHKPRQQAAPKGKPPDLDPASSWPEHHYWTGFDDKGAKLANCLTCHVRLVEMRKAKAEQDKRDREWRQSQRAQGDGDPPGWQGPPAMHMPKTKGAAGIDASRPAVGKPRSTAPQPAAPADDPLADLQAACDSAVAATLQPLEPGVITDKQVERLREVEAAVAAVPSRRLVPPDAFRSGVRITKGEVGPWRADLSLTDGTNVELVESAELAAAEVTIARLHARLTVWTHLQLVDLDTAALLRVPIKRTDVVRIVGFDPGFAHLGIMVIDFAPSSVRCVFTRKVTTTTDMPDEQRLDLLAREIESVIHRLAPTAVGYEAVAAVAAGVSDSTPKSAAAHRLLEVLGMIRSSCIRWRVPCHVVAVSSAKVAALGAGNTRGASKQDVKDALAALLGLRRLNSEVADAGAVALATYARHAGLRRERPRKPRKPRSRRPAPA